jgi:hypothetical protein
MILQIMRPLSFWSAIGRKTGSHPRIKSEGMLLLIALGAGRFVLDVR